MVVGLGRSVAAAAGVGAALAAALAEADAAPPALGGSSQPAVSGASVRRKGSDRDREVPRMAAECNRNGPPPCHRSCTAAEARRLALLRQLRLDEAVELGG